MSNESKTIEEKIAEHKAQSVKIDEAVKKNLEDDKELQVKHNAIIKNLQTLKEMKIARLAAINTLDGMVEPQEHAPPPAGE